MEMPRWLYTTEHFFFFFTTAELLRLNLHDNVCGISFFLPGKCISLSFELIMSPASSRELAGENTNVCQGWGFFFLMISERYYKSPLLLLLLLRLLLKACFM